MLADVGRLCLIDFKGTMGDYVYGVMECQEIEMGLCGYCGLKRVKSGREIIITGLATR